MTVFEIAEWLGGRLVGDVAENVPDITGVAKIEEAGPGHIAFLANPKYEKYLNTTKATAVLVSRKLDTDKFNNSGPCVLIVVDDPYTAFVRVLKKLTPSADPFWQGVHPSAVIASDAKIGRNVSIGPCSVIGEGAKIGDDTKIGPGCIIGNEAALGNGCTLYPGVIVYHKCSIGNNVVLHGGAVIGSDGFGFAPKPDGTFEKIPQLGVVIIDDDVEIGANTTIDRATMGETRIHRGVKIDNLVQIAHNVVVGENTVIAAQAGISGSTKVGRNCMLAGQVGLAGHITIADRTIIMAQSGIHQNISEEGKSFFGYPADEARKAQRVYIAMKMLPDMLREFTAMKNKIADLEKRLGEKSI